MSSEVSILKCNEYSDAEVKGAVKEAVDLIGGASRFIKRGERILIKPNLLAGKPPDAAVTTHPAVVRAAIELVKEAGGVPVVGDSPAVGNAMKVAERCGIARVAEDLSVDIIDLSTAVTVENPSSRTFKRLEIAKEVLEVDGIINLPKLKTHAQMYLTMGVKNIFGCVPGKRKVQWHFSAGVNADDFAGMILDLYLHLRPRLTIIDAVVSMEGNGPASGSARRTGFVAASPDAIALDRVMVEVLGARVTDVPILKKAAEYGIEASDLSTIDVLGQGVDDVRAEGFEFPPLISTNFASVLPGFLDRRLRKALTSRPHIEDSRCRLCALCVRVCPAETMTEAGRIVIDYDRCIRCFCCQEMCPWHAISVKEGWLKRLLPGM